MATQEAFASRTAERTAVRRRPAVVALWTVQVLLAVFLIVASGLPKFAGQQDAVQTFTKIGWGQWFRYFTGVVEVAGGVGLLVPRLAGLASLGLIGVMAGAVVTQVFVLEPAWATFPAVLGVVFGVISHAHRRETAALLDRVLRR
ncbi:DoxX family protein [Actinomadura sp. NPDC047616]|uniref:DoxX family protein n=1 Tax=Actinomadura sp. NPDC047616 TaxID=3155914 RepID=UPI0033E459C6